MNQPAALQKNRSDSNRRRPQRTYVPIISEPLDNRPLNDPLRRLLNVSQNYDRMASIGDVSTLPLINGIGVDGERHINVGSAAETDLGKLLMLEAMLPFEHPVAGSFKSIAGYAAFLQSPDDNYYRSVRGSRARGHARHQGYDRKVPGFWALVMDAYWHKLQQYPELAQALRECDLPLDYYYVTTIKTDTGRRPWRKRSAEAAFVIKGLEIIRSALRAEKAYPDLFEVVDAETHEAFIREQSEPIGTKLFNRASRELVQKLITDRLGSVKLPVSPAPEAPVAAESVVEDETISVHATIDLLPSAGGEQPAIVPGVEVIEGAPAADDADAAPVASTHDSTGAMAAAYFGTPGAEQTIENVFGSAEEGVGLAVQKNGE